MVGILQIVEHVPAHRDPVPLRGTNGTWFRQRGEGQFDRRDNAGELTVMGLKVAKNIREPRSVQRCRAPVQKPRPFIINNLARP